MSAHLEVNGAAEHEGENSTAFDLPGTLKVNDGMGMKVPELYLSSLGHEGAGSSYGGGASGEMNDDDMDPHNTSSYHRKKKSRSFSVRERVAYVEACLAEGASLADFSRRNDLVPATLHSWTVDYKSGKLKLTHDGDWRVRRRGGKYEIIEDKLLEYIELNYGGKAEVSWRELQAKALELANELLPPDVANGFRASQGWISRVLGKNAVVEEFYNDAANQPVIEQQQSGDEYGGDASLRSPRTLSIPKKKAVGSISNYPNASGSTLRYVRSQSDKLTTDEEAAHFMATNALSATPSAAVAGIAVGEGGMIEGAGGEGDEVPQPTRKIRSYSVRDRVAFVEAYLNEGTSVVSFAQRNGLSQGTLHGWVHEYRAGKLRLTNDGDVRIRRKAGKYDNVAAQVIAWLKSLDFNERVNTKQQDVQQRAMQIAAEILPPEQAAKFKGSMNWIMNFMKPHGGLLKYINNGGATPAGMKEEDQDSEGDNLEAIAVNKAKGRGTKRRAAADADDEGGMYGANESS